MAKFPKLSNTSLKKSVYCANVNKSTITKDQEGTYIGPLLQGQKEGLGIMLYNAGFLYEGAWANNERSGDGRLLDAEGDLYEGEWQHNEANGEGTYEGTSPKRNYVGGWSQGRMEGRGI